MDDFPLRHGFKFNQEYNEWQKLLTSNVVLVIREKTNEINIWELSSVNTNDSLNKIIEGDEESIIKEILKQK